MREFFKTSWTTKQDTNRFDHYCAVALKFIIPYTLAEIRELFSKWSWSVYTWSIFLFVYFRPLLLLFWVWILSSLALIRWGCEQITKLGKNNRIIGATFVIDSIVFKFEIVERMLLRMLWNTYMNYVTNVRISWNAKPFWRSLDANEESCLFQLNGFVFFFRRLVYRKQLLYFCIDIFQYIVWDLTLFVPPRSHWCLQF